MIRLEHPNYIFFTALLILPVAAYLWYNWWQNRAFNKLGERKLVERMIQGYSKEKPVLKFTLVIVALLLIIIGAANPQWGSVNKSEKKEGIDVAIVLDVSNSMLCMDVKPNRLTAAKQLATELINQLPDSRLALVSFAGDPVIQLPLTPDHASMQMMLDDASAESVPVQGTNLGDALSKAIQALPENQNHYKAIVLISDGEDQVSSLTNAIRDLNDAHIMVCAAGVGTTSGGFIPNNSPKRVSQFKKDAAGNTITSKMNPASLQKIARKTNGLYVDASANDNKAVAKIMGRLNGIEKNVYDKQLFVQYESRFAYFLLAAMLLLVLDLFISTKKQQWPWKKAASAKSKYIAVLVGFVLLLSASALSAQTVNELVLNGNALYKQGNYTDALQLYQQAVDMDATHQYPQALFNLGNALYTEKKYADAASEYQQFLQLRIAPALKAQAYFNLGNCYLAKKNYTQSIMAFKNTININSKDNDARYNLAYALAMLNKQQVKKQQSKAKPAKDNKKPPPQKEDMSPEQIKQLLQSLNQSEKGTIDKIKKENALTHQNKVEKDW